MTRPFLRTGLGSARHFAQNLGRTLQAGVIGMASLVGSLAHAAEPPPLAKAPAAPLSPTPPTPGTASQPALESNVVSLAGRDGFRFRTLRGDFELNPYTLLQAYVQANYSDSRWLALTDQDNVRALGFGTANAILGIAGRGFERVTFNLSLNAACVGPCLLNQAWVDLKASDSLRLRVGKFKTPAHFATQVRIGQTLLPRLPASLLARVTLPVGLNSVPPSIALGFDTGAMVHGIIAKRFEYQLGVFNGEGAGVNGPTSTLSDSHRFPGLLYAARLTYQPLGLIRPEESTLTLPAQPTVLLGLSSSYNVEANGESSDDFRAGAEAVLQTSRVFASAEAYVLRMAFAERQRGLATKMFIGAYAQMGVSVLRNFEPVLRFEVFDRNSITSRGLLLIPALGMNYYIAGQNMKVSALYQARIATRYINELEALQDDSAIYSHGGLVQMQFSL